jgi:hypothetical protein
MFILLILGVLVLCIKKYKPRIEWIQQSQMLIMYYNTKQSRDYIILWKNI